MILKGWLKIARSIKREKKKKFFVKTLELCSSYRLKKNIKASEVKKKVKI